MSTSDDTTWGSDVPVSMPAAHDPGEVLVDMGTHVFTRSGLRVKASDEVRREITANSWHPVDGGGD